MSGRRVLAALGLAALGLAGCAGQDWSRNIYEGVRQSQGAAGDPNRPSPSMDPAAMPEYERYRREREALREGGP